MALLLAARCSRIYFTVAVRVDEFIHVSCEQCVVDSVNVIY